MLETPNFYPYLNAVDNLKIVAEIKDLKNPEPYIDKALKKVNLWKRKDTPFKTFSLGMKQRLALASAMLNDPDVMELDEPRNGLDPQGIAEIRSLIQEIAKGGKTIIIASHLLDEIEKLCSHVAILKDGALLKAGTLEKILIQDKILYVEAPDLKQLASVFNNSDAYEVIKNEEKGIMIKVDDSVHASEVNKYCAENGVYLSALSEHKNNLESIFLELVN